MSRIVSFFRMIGTVARYGNSRIGDVAIFKADVFLGRVRPEAAAEFARLDPIIPSIDMAALRALPAGTFGRGYADFLDDNDLQPFVVQGLHGTEVLARNVHWARYALMHDMIHVLLGAGPDLVGEMKVYGFTLAQRLGLAFWLFLPLAWLVMPLLAPHRTLAMIREFRAGYRLGRKSPGLLARPLDQHFAEPIDDVRDRVGLPRLDEAALPAAELGLHHTA